MDKDRLSLFTRRLNRLMLSKHWSGADLAREASKFVPESHRGKDGKRYVVGRHLVSAYSRGENEPTAANLSYVARALEVEPGDLLTAKKTTTTVIPIVQAVTSLGGKTRLIVDAELDTDIAMQVMTLIQDSMT